MILGLGEDVLSVTCREHPRFWEEYGARRETCLSISCPEAARLLLEEPLELCEKETDDPVPEDPELDSEFLHQLLIFRQALFALTRSRRSLADQFSLALDAAENGISLPPEGVISTEFWNDVPAPPLSLALTAYLVAMESMEFTRPQLKELLPRVIADSTPLSFSDPEMQEDGSRILFYFLYRYVLRGSMERFGGGKGAACCLQHRRHPRPVPAHGRLHAAPADFGRRRTLQPRSGALPGKPGAPL